MNNTIAAAVSRLEPSFRKVQIVSHAKLIMKVLYVLFTTVFLDIFWKKISGQLLGLETFEVLKYSLLQWHAEIFNDVCNMQRHKVLHVADALVLRGKQLVTLSFIVRLIVAKRTYFRKQLILKHLKYLNIIVYI